MDHISTPKVDNVRLMTRASSGAVALPSTAASSSAKSGNASILGSLYVTTTHLIFVSTSDTPFAQGSTGEADPTPGCPSTELWILHTLMSSIEKPTLTTAGTQIRIQCSHFRTATFIIQKDKDAHDVYTSLLALSKPKRMEDLYAFSYNPNGELTQSTGWQFHDIQAEFQRQGVPNSNWSLCTLNRDYALCPTYPKHLFIPSKASQPLVEGSARFRSKGRLPVLTYLHRNGAALIRCAQPLVGISGVRSPHDEQYVECLRRATPGAHAIHIVDTRPPINAMANRAGGKGYESDKYYENIAFCFKGIDNIHKMRASLKALTASIATTMTMDAFITELANSGWLKHVKAVLDSSVAIMGFVADGKSVIVHCSDGWDRTSQTCALAQIMLDGYFRTVQGFQALIEKDWLAFGHKFSERCGHLDGDPNEVSPTFVQFLDATWQLMQLFPQSFQFNEKYLICIQEHTYSSRYGTFLGNCQRDREMFKLKEKTYSLWGYLVNNSTDFVNPLYDSNTSQDILRPNTSPQNIKFWSGLYCRFENGAHQSEPLIDLHSVMQNHTSSLEDHGRQLSKTFGQMTQLLASAAGSGSGAVRRMLPNSPNKDTAMNKPKPTSTTSFGGNEDS